MAESTDKLVFAAVEYLNAAPLAEFLSEVCPDAEVIYDRPANLAAMLADGRADVAMVPVADLFAKAGLKMIEGIGVCADGDVWSVLLKCDRPPEQIRSVARDPASKTSNALAEIILSRHLGLSVEMVDADNGLAADARVVIGDKALCGAPAACADLDLAGLWKEMTALGFVFAVWAYREDRCDAEALTSIAHRAKRAGLAAADSLAEKYAPQIGIPSRRCLEYLTEVIRYDIDSRCAEGMELFGRMLAERDATSPQPASPEPRKAGGWS